MKTLKEVTKENDKETAARLARIRIANMYDSLDSLEYSNQCLDLNIRTIFQGQRFAGRVLTVHGRSAPYSRDEVFKHEESINYHTVRDAVTPGCVVIMDGDGSPWAGRYGEMTSWGLQQRGAVALVADGYVRDYLGLVELKENTGFAVCARGTTPVEGRRRWTVEAIDTPIAMSGTLLGDIRVAPGDWVCGGPDGIIVVPDEITEKLLEVAEDIEYRENEMRKSIVAGMDFSDAAAKYLRE